MNTFETEAAFGKVQAYGKGPESPSVHRLKKQTINVSVPNWCHEMVTKQDEAKVYINPSRLLTDKKYKFPAHSPLRKNNDFKFSHGNIIHKLLEILPDVELEKRLDVADKILQNHNINDKEYKNKISTEVFSILDSPEFSKIFSPGSKAEVSIIGYYQELW